jgi:phage terminase small subunit
VLREVARLAFSDHRRLYNSDGTLKRPDELDDDTAAAVASVEVFEQYEGRGKSRTLVGYTKKVKLSDKNAALDKS